MYQIGQSFTRLEGAINFHGLADQVSLDDCVLSDPPKHLAALHSAALINAWSDRLQQVMAMPTQTERRIGHRRVQVLGSAVFDFDPRGRVQAYIWSFSELDLPELQQIPDAYVVAEGVPYEALWMNGFKEGVLRELQSRHPGKRSECQDYVDWAAAQFLQRFWDADGQKRVRAQIYEALALDPQLLGIARQIQLTGRQQAQVRLQGYNHVVAHRSHYRTLTVEAPQLIALYALLADEIESSVDVTSRMKIFLNQEGIGAAMWRLLTRVGTEWMQEFLPYFNFDHETTGSVALEILEMAQAFGTAELVPAYLLHALIQIGGNPNRPSCDFVSLLESLYPLCARLGHVLATADEATKALLQEHATQIFNWASDHEDRLSTPALRRASVPSLIRRVKAYALLEQKKYPSLPQWDLPYSINLGNDVSAVILDSAYAIWKEGQDMRHCADNYIERCVSGDVVMVSLREKQHKHGLATLAFRIDGDSVSLYRYSGFANRMVSQVALDLAERCRRSLERQIRERQQKEQPAEQLAA